jgi:hypothetical protein
VTEQPSQRRPRQPGPEQPNFAERLFPGPSPVMSREVRARIEGLIKERSRSARPTTTGRTPGVDRSPGATAADVTQLHDSLDQQNELLRAILASSVDTQADARATAQNSRTFAWAGTVIALFTLIATVISIIAVIQAH